MFKILSTYICWKKIYKMQHLEGSGMPVLYIGRKVLKVNNPVFHETMNCTVIINLTLHELLFFFFNLKFV